MQFQDLFNWLMSLSTQYGYVGVFLVTAVAAVSLFFPIPDTIVVFTVGSSLLYEPVWVALIATFGATLGEFSAYLLGYSGRKTLNKRYGRNMNLLQRLFQRFGTLAIFIFALTPLPDELVFIPLGALRYNAAKVFVPAFVGKLIMYLAIVYAGRFFIDSVADAVSVTNDWLPSLLSMIIGIVTFFLMLKVDWGKYLERYLFKDKP